MPAQIEIKETKRNGGIEAIPKRAKESALKVGLISGLGVHPNSEDGLTIVEIGAKNEFGVGVPERSFLRSTIANNISKYNKMRRDLLSQVILFKISTDKAIAILGEQLKSDVQQAIVDIDTPPNSQETIDKKGSSNPLIDTGTMRKSINWEQLK